MILTDNTPFSDPLRIKINNAYRMDENECVNRLIELAEISPDQQSRIAVRATELIKGVRRNRQDLGGLDAFLTKYDLSSEEGIALMCLAEALLRIPDKETINKIISDKIGKGKWNDQKNQNSSMFVNAMTWGLMLTGKLLSPQKTDANNMMLTLKNMVGRSGMPAIRMAVNYMMKIMSQQFVMGQTINDAIKRARELEIKGYRYSYDMLGEAARTREDAERYFKAYEHAIAELAKVASSDDVRKNPGISIKLSALNPRYEFGQRALVLEDVTNKLLRLSMAAKAANINLTVDAEEANRLDLSLDIIEATLSNSSLKGWDGFGLAVQSYQKRAMPLLDWLIELAKKTDHRIMLRLIKGAYWDSEIKRSQVDGFAGYPVFTRKASTDLSFLACAKKIIANTDYIYPQFATHNAYSLAAIMEFVGDYRDFEFQCLHGMGQPLYDQIVGEKNLNIPCRIYAPVGGYEDLLAYLVRRLLENGANTSFVNRISDENAPIDDLVESPVKHIKKLKNKAHPAIPTPSDIYGTHRKNAAGLDLSDRQKVEQLSHIMQEYEQYDWQAKPLIGDQKIVDRDVLSIVDPSDNRRVVGSVIESNEHDIAIALDRASIANAAWSAKAVTERAACLRKMADLLEENMPMLMTIAVREAGKTLPDSIAEVREAIDFCRYYANQAENLQGQPEVFPGPTGEYNHMQLTARGIVVCISPWNFPLAIFLGQVAAALVVGNTVIAKPAEQTPLIACQAVKLFYQAGIPNDVLQLLPGRGEIVGAKLTADPRVKAVMFTGSTQTAKAINRTLANREGEIVPLIAETGGQNAMIVDSSALPEQLVQDVVQSAFGSAGQRCSALRVLYVQEEIFTKVSKMLAGAMKELKVGDPGYLKTDIGPVIDNDAKAMLDNHFNDMQQTAKLIYRCELPEATQHGHYFAPSLFQIDSINVLKQEFFGPFLHIVSYARKDLDKVINDINATGFGLTCGIQSRISDSVEYIASRMKVGNCYINRNMIGAVVGVQPFGGQGLSGTGPKAGGPHYLPRLCNEQVLTIDTTAQGGNASLLSLSEEEEG